MLKVLSDGILYIPVIQGEDLEFEISWEDEEGTEVDVSGYSAKMQFRREPGDEKLYLEASTENGKIIVDTADNVLKAKIPAEEINNLTFNTADTDFFVTSPQGKPYKLFKAKAELIKRITV